MRNKLTDVRDHLIHQMETLRDCDPEQLAQEIERAKAMVSVGHVLIDSAKVEIEAHKTIDGALPTGFLPVKDDGPGLPRLVKGV